MSKHINVSTLDELGNELSEHEDRQVIVDFWATWCGPCRIMGPILDDINDTEKVDVIKIDVDKNPEVSSILGIQSIPTMMFFRNGKTSHSPIIGAVSKEQVLQWIR